MKLKFKISLTPLFVLEIVACVLFIIAFGFGNFLIFILISMLCGVVLLAVFWKNMLEFEFIETRLMFRQFSYVIAGFLLVFPGVLTSILAVLILVFALSLNLLTRNSKSHQKTKNTSNDEIIDVEIIEDKQ